MFNCGVITHFGSLVVGVLCRFLKERRKCSSKSSFWWKWFLLVLFHMLDNIVLVGVFAWNLVSTLLSTYKEDRKKPHPFLSCRLRVAKIWWAGWRRKLPTAITFDPLIRIRSILHAFGVEKSIIHAYRPPLKFQKKAVFYFFFIFQVLFFGFLNLFGVSYHS